MGHNQRFEAECRAMNRSSTMEARTRTNREAIKATFPDWKAQRVAWDFGILLHGGARQFPLQVLHLPSTSDYGEIHHSTPLSVFSTLFILTRLDYCSSLLAVLLKFRIWRLQSVFNCTARIVVSCKFLNDIFGRWAVGELMVPRSDKMMRTRGAFLYIWPVRLEQSVFH